MADQAAGDRRFVAMLEMLASRHEITLLIQHSAFPPPEQHRYLGLLYRIGVKHLILGGDYMRQAMRLGAFDLGLFEFHSTAGALAGAFTAAQPGVPYIIDSVDIHFARETAAAALGQFPPDAVTENMRRELAAYARADGVIVITAEDDATVRQHLPSLKTWLVPIIVPIRSRRSIRRAQSVLFIGGFKHQPNVDGIIWFAREVWPQVTRRHPSASLDIVGGSAPDEVKALDGKFGIAVKGYVPDTNPYLDAAAVSIAPLRYGAGMKGKVTEALASGIPVVSTSVGAQGFGARPGQHLQIGDTADDFAEAVVDLLGNPTNAEAMGQRGQDLVREICSPELVAGRLHRLVEDAAQRRRPLSTPMDRLRVRFKGWARAMAHPFRESQWRQQQEHLRTLFP